MSKFNKPGVGYVESTKTTNAAGGLSFKRTNSEAELASIILNSMLNGDSFYESEEDRISRIRTVCEAVEDKEFIAKAMVYTRKENNLRSVSHVLANILAEQASGKSYVRRAIRSAILRPDDMTEMFSLWKSRHNAMLPNSMRRAFKDVLETKFDAYQIKKYAQPRASVKLKDIVKIAHPRDEKGIFKKLIEDNLENIVTIERELSSGQNAGEAVGKLLAEKKIGYMAALKNIRNALESGMTDESLNDWIDLITNRKIVLKSRVLPFRYVDAWNSIENINFDRIKLNKIKAALNKAISYSLENLGILEKGETCAIAIDCSSSMNGGYRTVGSYSPWKTAATLAATLYSGLDEHSTLVYKFSSSLERLDNLGSPLDFVGTKAKGGATYGHLPLEELIRTKTVVDKVFMFTDMQVYNMQTWGRGINFVDTWKQYKKIAPKAKLMFWNVEGYNGGTPVSLLESDIYEMNGFSDKLLKIVPKLWADKNALVDEIKKISLN